MIKIEGMKSMKEKHTLEQKLLKRKIKKPNFIYGILGRVWKALFFKKYGVKVIFNKDFRKEKGPYILISNHASRLDYMYTGLPLLPNRYNFVAGYNEFFRSHLKGVFHIAQVIPKKNFTADIYTIKQIKRVLEQKGKIIIFPEGMSSISGSNQPVAVGTGKFIKHCQVPVYFSIIKGGYLTSPKYCLDERLGYVEVVFDQLFTIDEIGKLTPEEIEQKINQTLYHDDYEWNKKEQHHYQANGEIAKQLETLLYWCPKCHREYGMIGEKDKIYCKYCGNGATLDDTYTMHPFDETCIIPETQTKWFDMQRQNVKEEIKDEKFCLTEEVELGILPQYEYLKHQKTSKIVGTGKITFTKEGLTYDGTREGKPYCFHINTSELPTYGMCTDVSRFYTFYHGEFVEFYPKHKTVEKWFLVTEEMHRLNGGKWKDFKKIDK